MSFHILHIGEHGCVLSKDRGLLVCKKDGKITGSIAMADMRALVLLSEAVSYSAAVTAALLENDAVILHCRRYKPIGVTLPLPRVYDARTALTQGASPKILNREIWRKLLHCKIANSIASLEELGVPCGALRRALSKSSPMDEARCARLYWRGYFPAIGAYGERREPKDAASRPNAMLNYGYGVVGALAHRALIVHGLSPLYGVCHKTYYKNNPLVYDVMEPYRAIVDMLLYRFLLQKSFADMNGWTRYIGSQLREFRIARKGASLKLMDSLDVLASSLANCYKEKSAKGLWLPYINPDYEKISGKTKSF